MNQLCGVGHITAQAFVLTLRSKQRFPTFQVSKQKALVSVRASPIGGEIVADFEETRQFWNFTMPEIKLAGRCCSLRMDDNTLEAGRNQARRAKLRCTLLTQPN
jgi:hypothetical protein